MRHETGTRKSQEAGMYNNVRRSSPIAARTIGGVPPEVNPGRRMPHAKIKEAEEEEAEEDEEEEEEALD